MASDTIAMHFSAQGACDVYKNLSKVIGILP